MTAMPRSGLPTSTRPLRLVMVYNSIAKAATASMPYAQKLNLAAVILSPPFLCYKPSPQSNGIVADFSTVYLSQNRRSVDFSCLDLQSPSFVWRNRWCCFFSWWFNLDYPLLRAFLCSNIWCSLTCPRKKCLVPSSTKPPGNLPFLLYPIPILWSHVSASIFKYLKHTTFKYLKFSL